MKTYDMREINGDIGMACAIKIKAPYEWMFPDAAKDLNVPARCILPCGNEYILESINDLPETDLPCPCGNQNHWFVKYEVDPSLHFRS